LPKPKICANALSAQTLSLVVPQHKGWRAVEACFKLKSVVIQSSTANWNVESKCGVLGTGWIFLN